MLPVNYLDLKDYKTFSFLNYQQKNDFMRFKDLTYPNKKDYTLYTVIDTDSVTTVYGKKDYFKTI